MRAYELGDITGLIKSKGLLHRLLTKCEAAADGAHSVGGFQFRHDLVKHMYMCIKDWLNKRVRSK